MRAITLAEANRIIEGTFASAQKREAYALAASLSGNAAERTFLDSRRESVLG